MKELIANKLLSDPKVTEAKKLLLEAVKEHQKHVIEIRPPLAHLKKNYDDLIKEFEELRGVSLWYPYIGSGFGNGPFVELADGSVKYDFISGIGVHFGHSHPDLIETSIVASIKDTIMQGNLQQNYESLLLARKLKECSKLDHIFFTTSGAMACENALKIIFQKKFPAKRVIAFERCFMGRTIATSQITDKAEFREGIPASLQVDYIPFYDPKHPDESLANALKAMKAHIKRYPKDHAALCLELIQGEGGFNVGSKEFFLPLIQLAKENNMAIFVDEVQTFGRTYELFAYQYFGLQDYVDAVSFGKQSQVCGTLFKDTLKPKAGLLSQTFIGSTSAILASLKIIETLTNGSFFGSSGKIAKLHTGFSKKLQEMHQSYPDLIDGPFGIGTMLSFTPYKGNKEKVIAFAKALYEAGVITFIAGDNPTKIRMLLPIGSIDQAHINNACTIIEKVLLEKSI